MVLRAWPVLALLVLAACAGPAPQPGVTTTPTGAMTSYPLAETEAFLVTRLQNLGFVVEDRPETGVIAATIERGAPAEWAFCDRIEVRDAQDGNRTHWADAETLRVRVNLRLSELGGGTSVTVSPRFTGVYRNRFDNLPFDRLCASAGVLEPQILAQAQAG
jgi:hypothetical protein